MGSAHAAVATGAKALATGAVGCNFEDQLIGGEGLHPFDLQVKRIAAIRRAVRDDFSINARTGLFLKTQTYDDALIAQVVERGKAFADDDARAPPHIRGMADAF